METDLLGDPVEVVSRLGKGRSGKGKQWGYIMPPGTGPAGETCASCKHIARTPRFRKCRLAKANWTHGFKTDILARSPACSRWELSDIESLRAAKSLAKHHSELNGVEAKGELDVHG